jgi:hypothetical protein
MRTYDSYEDACRDSELDLRIRWECDQCGRIREEPPGYNEGGECSCGGQFEYVGESYRG